MTTLRGVRVLGRGLERLEDGLVGLHLGSALGLVWFVWFFVSFGFGLAIGT